MNELELWQTLRNTPQLMADIAAVSGSELQRQSQLRKKYPAELVRLGLELATLRQKAAGKFSESDQLWLTRQSLEQATSEVVARYKAQRFARYVGDEETSPLTVLDLCSGMGADAVALAEHLPVLAYDLDPIMRQLAGWNAEIYGVRERIEFLQQDVTLLDVTGKILHIDPDQRDANGRRHLRLEQVQPELSQLQQMASVCRAGAIKLSPASNFGGKFPDCEIELISLQGECKAAVIWCGELGEPGLWRATVLPSGETLAGDPLSVWPEFTTVNAYIYDPDPAIVRAGLINILAESQQLQRLDDADEYLTSETYRPSPFVTGFRVLEVLNRNETQLKKYLRAEQVGIVEIKCRHVPVEIERVRKSLNLSGDRAVTLIYARVAGKTHIIVCERMPAA